MKTDLSKYNNSWYKPGGKIKRLLWYLINAIFFNSPLHINFIKIFLLRLFGAKVGTGVILKPFLNIKYHSSLLILPPGLYHELLYLDKSVFNY